MLPNNQLAINQSWPAVEVAQVAWEHGFHVAAAGVPILTKKSDKDSKGLNRILENSFSS